MVCIFSKDGARKLLKVQIAADSLDFVIHILSQPQHANVQQALRKEVRALHLPATHDTPLSSGQLNAIRDAPLLDAVIKETLRCYPPSSISKQRKVPKGGRVLDGYFVPEDTLVGAPVAMINWNDEIYGGQGKWHTREWLPQRWLEEQPARVKEMEKRLFSFGTGVRACIGRQ